MARQKMVDGVVVQLSPAEEAERDAEEAKFAEYQAANGFKERRRAAIAAQMPVDLQLEALLDGGQKLTDLRATYAAIKAAHPKPA